MSAQVEHKGTQAHLPPHPEKATMESRNKVLGFWFLIGAETVLFACLFGTYLALKDSTMGGPSTEELYQIPMVALATFILLTSSLTSVLGVLGIHRNNIKQVKLWFWVTVVLGAAFLGLEIYEFFEYVHEGHTFTSSAFGSAFYTLVGTHGSHVLFGITWIFCLLIQLSRRGLNMETAPKLYVASLYWHFVDVVWVFIFTVVYLMGKVG
ncbi:cytochrome (ubi)quinol oxidase subunit III [Paludifilum halophilum]|uniref:Cytochrome (Ubi)quinol oxidase subunit III n=1 Tax=Paludifilum halophilum TaxID=1642702 RepID=A0A235B455_9BACL|nr:cytochrome (ubi)quinol oxidase subunit III [Paludifilum halophilum]OYD07011.1 cytochrome (ubi)quinol oxidase subunit III [Paludifilum halophilum]